MGLILYLEFSGNARRGRTGVFHYVYLLFLGAPERRKNVRTAGPGWVPKVCQNFTKFLRKFDLAKDTVAVLLVSEFRSAICVLEESQRLKIKRKSM